MTEETDHTKTLLPHHEQQPLCTTRKPYRQGRKLTAVKTYTITSESNHLLIFGVPSLNLRQETKSLFIKFGKLKQFILTTDYPNEKFTDTYHAVFENIASARIAKKMLDTKNFYGAVLHICYAPELETIQETRYKLFKRQRDVIYRLNYLKTDERGNTNFDNNDATENDNVNFNVETHNQIYDNVKNDNYRENTTTVRERLDMGEINTICIGKQISDVVFDKRKRKHDMNSTVVIEKQFKPCFIQNEVDGITHYSINDKPSTSKTEILSQNKTLKSQYEAKGPKLRNEKDEIKIIDFTSTERETLCNINEGLNFNKFGNEIVRRDVKRPVNKVVFCFNSNKKLI